MYLNNLSFNQFLFLNDCLEIKIDMANFYLKIVE